MPPCNFVSPHCPSGAAIHHMIETAQIDLMKSKVLINTARGDIINEHDLGKSYGLKDRWR